MNTSVMSCSRGVRAPAGATVGVKSSGAKTAAAQVPMEVPIDGTALMVGRQWKLETNSFSALRSMDSWV